jgi:hypothetical protein
MPAASPWYVTPWNVTSRSKALGAARGNLGRLKRHRAHVDGGADELAGRLVHVELDLASPATRVDDQALAVAEALANRHPGEAADPVAAHLGPAAVGVAQLHRAVGAVPAGEQRDEPVGADPPVPVTQAHGEGGVRAAPARHDGHEEVVARPVQLGEPEAGGAHEPQVASTVGSTAQGLSAAPTHVIRGSRRNHIR